MTIFLDRINEHVDDEINYLIREERRRLGLPAKTLSDDDDYEYDHNDYIPDYKINRLRTQK